MQASLLKFKNGMTVVLNWTLIVVVALLVFDVCWGVFSRYVIGEQTKWTEELARFLLRAGIHRALVLDGSALQGIVTATDVLRAVAGDDRPSSRA